MNMKDAMNAFNEYIKSLVESDVVNQNEHTGRTHLETLLNELKPEDIQITHEGKRHQGGLGAPDFTVNHTKKHTVVGYIENKKIDENLRKVLKSEQIEKYRKLSENLILTDYLEWIWIYKDSDPVHVRLCESQDLLNKKFKLSQEKAQELRDLLSKFYSCEPGQITTAEDLAKKLARPSTELNAYIATQVELQTKEENASSKDHLYAIYETFKKGLFEELSTTDFADGFTQMLTYSIFLAKLNSNQILNLQNTQNHIPQAFSLIKTLSKFFDLLGEDKHKEIKWAVENILSVINNVDSLAIAESLGAKQGDEEKDPYIYFYEDFLREYNPKSKVDRGVYYTPPAVVRFIVDQVGDILEKDFELCGGLANNAVKVLDFACGTGTFLFESYKKVLEGTKENSFEKNERIEHLLKNFFGFEIMISSYIISHLKLSQFLKDKGYDISTKKDKRIGVYLTNTLEDKEDTQSTLFAEAVAEEGHKAREIKQDKEIIAIIGNPPYNVSSQNELHEKNELLAFHKKYKPEDEKNISPISDDYIKFIAFAHNKINKAGRGVIGVIVNNSFLKGLIHRKMRNELMKDFDKIYIIDLHGNARIGETAEDGSADQNVFNIMQGVCICLLVKHDDAKNKGVFHLDLYGKRAKKFERLCELERSQLTKLEIEQFNKDFRSTKWGKERFVDNLSFFAPMKQTAQMLQYGNFWGLTDIFVEYTSGVQSQNDSFCIQHNREDIEHIVEDLNSLNVDSIRSKYNIRKDDDYINGAKDSIVEDWQNRVCQIAYKPFDNRWTYLNEQSSGFLARPRAHIMQHMLKGDNVGFTCMRGFTGTPNFDQFFVTNCVSDKNFYGFQSYLVPLYLYKTAKETTQTKMSCVEDEEKKPNFKSEFAKMIGENFGNPSPEEILAFVYASMYSPFYRAEYLELLKIDFPRINFDVSPAEFKRLVKVGQELVDAHLMRKIPNLDTGECICPTGFDNIVVQKPKEVVGGRVYVSQDCYFANVSPQVWDFKVGGYQVLDKYIKERVDRVLTKEEIRHITNIIKVLGFTIEKMAEIDRK